MYLVRFTLMKVNVMALIDDVRLSAFKGVNFKNYNAFGVVYDTC